MPKLVRMQDPNDALAGATDLFSFENASHLKWPTTIARRGEDSVPYELEDALRVLLQQGVGPMTRACFSVADIEPLRLIDDTQTDEALLCQWQGTLDRLLDANVRLNGEPWRVRSLLNAGANPNNKQYHVLHEAIRRNKTDMFYALLDAGADLHLTDSNGHCAFLCAVSSGIVSMTRRVYEALVNADCVVGNNDDKKKKRKRSVGGQNNINDNNLNKTIKTTNNNKSKNLLLLAQNKRNNSGNNALDLAARSGCFLMVRLLVEEFDMQPGGCVYFAIESGHCPIIEYFFDKDPSLANARRSDGRCALTVAAAAGNIDSINLLVGKYEMNPTDIDVVCAAGRHDRVEALEQLGDWTDATRLDEVWKTVLETKDREGQRPIMAALLNGAYSAMIALAQMGSDVSEALFELVLRDDISHLREILEYKNENLLGHLQKGETLLTWAVTHGSIDSMMHLIEVEPKLWTMAREDGKTPLLIILDAVGPMGAKEEGVKPMLTLWLKTMCQRYGAADFPIVI